jgi:hypothetical protein
MPRRGRATNSEKCGFDPVAVNRASMHIQKEPQALRLHATSCSSKLSVLQIGLHNSNPKRYVLNIIASNQATSVKTILKTVLLGWAYRGTACAKLDGCLPLSAL